MGVSSVIRSLGSGSVVAALLAVHLAGCHDGSAGTSVSSSASSVTDVAVSSSVTEDEDNEDEEEEDEEDTGRDEVCVVWRFWSGVC